MYRALLALGVLAAAGCADNETAIARGDRLWADSNYAGARAEYRLATAQRGDGEALSRLAHAYARTGDLAEAKRAYDQLLARDRRFTDQAALDYLFLARRALQRGDEWSMATAVDAALALRPELRLAEFELPAARYHAARGDADRAMAHYRRALTVLPADSAPRVLYEMGRLEEGRGRCGQAVELYRGFREQARRDGSTERGGPLRSLVTESRWHLGNCEFRLAQAAREEGRVTDALVHLETMIGLGVPENLLDQAWFDRGETLYGVGRFDEALEAYRQVMERNPTRTGQLVERARRRIDEIRFGVMPEDGER